ncbi:MAG: tetratricopeptide repeat protein, partial [Gemmatimonadetes bacterium]|nr:tetratricopeptide repeat protein [Gemmatimonadota bacterium]
MEQRELPVAALFRVLPDIPELTPLREALLSASTPDPAKAWASSSSYVTVDKRVLPADRLEAIARGAEDAVRRRVGRVYEALTGVLRSIATGDEAGAVDQLIVLGETAEADEQWRDARAYLEAAAQLAAPISDRRPLSRALRRLARAEWNLGDVDAAYTRYRRSLAAARAAADQEATIVAFVGLGNMRSFQGRWSEAQAHYEAALA